MSKRKNVTDDGPQRKRHKHNTIKAQITNDLVMVGYTTDYINFLYQEFAITTKYAHNFDSLFGLASTNVEYYKSKTRRDAFNEISNEKNTNTNNNTKPSKKKEKKKKNKKLKKRKTKTKTQILDHKLQNNNKKNKNKSFMIDDDIYPSDYDLDEYFDSNNNIKFDTFMADIMQDLICIMKDGNEMFKEEIKEREEIHEKSCRKAVKIARTASCYELKDK